MVPESTATLRDSPTRFLAYDMRQLMGQGRGNRATRQPRQRPIVLETIEEQDEAIRGLAEIELVDLEAQQDDTPLDDLLSDSSDEDYEPVPRMPPPRPHNREASGSNLAPAPTP